MKTGINIQPCNVNSAELHNCRDANYLHCLDSSGKKAYEIFRDETSKNDAWINEDYKGQPLPAIMKKIAKEVKAKTGRAIQKKATPIREGVCPIKPDTRIEDFHPIIDWINKHGATVIRIDLHRDEGHVDPKTGERIHNLHAHIIFDNIDHRTGRSVKLNSMDMRELQTVTAEALGMERGELVEKTGRKHLSAIEYREKKAGESVAHLEKEKQLLLLQMQQGEKFFEEELRNMCEDMMQIGRNTIKYFNWLQQWDAKQAKPTTAEKNSFLKLQVECQNDITAYSIPDLKKELSTLWKLVIENHKSVQRIGMKLQDIATSIPFFRKHRLEHEAKLQDAAESGLAAKKEAQTVISAAKKAMEEANKRSAESADMVKHLQKHHEKEMSTLKEEIQALKDALSRSQDEAEKKKEQNFRKAVSTAKAIIQAFGAENVEKEMAFLPLEKNITSFKSWKTAKQELAQERKIDRKEEKKISGLSR